MGLKFSTPTDSQWTARIATLAAMEKRPTTEQQLRWSIYHIKGTPATFVGTVDNAPDGQTAIARAIEEYDVPPNERGG
jgi:hypothetical protein